MSSPFPCIPVIRECSWKKAHIEKKGERINWPKDHPLDEAPYTKTKWVGNININIQMINTIFWRKINPFHNKSSLSSPAQWSTKVLTHFHPIIKKLYFVIMSRTRFRVNVHSIFNRRSSFHKTGAKSKV